MTVNPHPIGLGAFVAVCGPSGGGKDSLIRGARELSRDVPDIVFPRRIVTRMASDAEDHDTASPGAFDEALAGGRFAIWWEAHGLKYALPVSIDSEIAAGRVAVCNVSRGVLAQLRRRYVRTVTVLVTAPADILLARIAGRARATDGDAAMRLSRSSSFGGDVAADWVIENTRSIDDGARKLFDVIEAQRVAIRV